MIRNLLAKLVAADHRANLSLVVSLVAMLLSGAGVYTAREALQENEKATVESQRTNLFSQFQQQYNSIAASFPSRYMDPTFRPATGTEAYARLQAYWFFCFSEWYATHRVDSGAFGSLWSDYYAPLIADGLKIPSLRYVLEDRIRSRGVGGGDQGILPTAICKNDFNSYKFLFCEGMATEFKFNAGTGRFLRTYTFGYWSYTPNGTELSLDKNDNGDTPYLEIGTCSKL